MDRLTKTAGAKLTAPMHGRLEAKAAAIGLPVSEYVRALIVKDLTTPDDPRFVAWLVCRLEQLLFETIAAPFRGQKLTMEALEKLRQMATATADGLVQKRGEEFQRPGKRGAK